MKRSLGRDYLIATLAVLAILGLSFLFINLMSGSLLE